MEYKRSKETRRRMSEAKRRFFENGGRPWNYIGMEIDCETCGKSFKIIPARKKTAKYCSIKCATGKNIFAKGNVPWNKGREHLRGKKHWNWRGGVDKEHTRIKQTIEYKEWRAAVYRRDGWKCMRCGYKGLNIIAHHIKSFSKYPELRFSVENGETLCRSCHQRHHKTRRKEYDPDN